LRCWNVPRDFVVVGRLSDDPLIATADNGFFPYVNEAAAKKRGCVPEKR
jgi:hypothetical protein